MYTAQGRIKQSELLTQYMPLVRRQALTLQVRLPASIELDDLIHWATSTRDTAGSAQQVSEGGKPASGSKGGRRWTGAR